jgi:CRP-like cAMP-binding protein
MSKNPFQRFVVRYGAGDQIFSEGERGASMYIVQSGVVSLFRELNGQKRVLSELEKGDFFGEMSILEGLPRTSSAEALEPAELIEINSITFDKMIKSNIEIAIRMLRKLSLRLREVERRLHEAQIAPGEESVQAAATAQPARSGAAAEQRSGVRLECEDGDVVYAVGEGDTMIGRFDPVTELNPDVDLTEVDLKRSVSRRHACISKNGDGYTVVEEVGALNGTFVNGTKLDSGQPVPLNDGDELGLGMVKLIFRT